MTSDTVQVVNDGQISASPAIFPLAQSEVSGSAAHSGDQSHIKFIASQIRTALNAIGHRADQMEAVIGQKPETALRFQRPFAPTLPKNKTPNDIRDQLILKAAQEIALDGARLNKHRSKLGLGGAYFNFSEKAQGNVRTFAPFGITGQRWGDAMLEKPDLIGYNPSTIADNFALNINWLSTYGVDSQIWANRIFRSALILLTRDPGTLELHFELGMKVLETQAARLDDVPKNFQAGAIKKMMSGCRKLTDGTDHFLLRLAAADLCPEDFSNIGLRGARSTVEAAVVAALGHNPREKVIPRAHHTVIENDAAVAKIWRPAIADYVSEVCRDLRRRWPEGATPTELGIPVSEIFMTQSNGSMGQADKVELRELMAVNGFFKEYRLDSPVNG